MKTWYPWLYALDKRGRILSIAEWCAIRPRPSDYTNGLRKITDPGALRLLFLYSKLEGRNEHG